MAKDDSFKLDQMVRSAWMYYVSGKNQTEIASQLGLSRPVVQRLIASAKEEGVVSIGLHHPIARCLDYAELLKEKYQLIECNIVPDSSEEERLDNVSFGCFQLMSKYLKNQTNKIIGIGSGLTLKNAIYRIDFETPESKCVALISAMAVDGICNYYDDVPLLLARKLQANYYQLPAPRYTLSLEEHDFWRNTNAFKNVSQVAESSDIIFIGVGALDNASAIVKDGFISFDKGEELRKQGAVGEILGRFISEDGQVVDCEINSVITSYDIRQNNCPRIATACGEEKRPAILAALKGKWINGLVTDEGTARWLLAR
ncbi:MULTISPECIES: sugar-binding transcriptional regulator [unclassified Aliivibrio]|uniref:sugar-binding transcriptional regulator n=1 Tax=unclassified Aliivibrio TaxID=2645654 RepID=UPI00080EB2D5|nr:MULTISPECIES: sugar-binding transcriptional regulator [unclassified Aliivibrio]OCH13725.1 cytochrome C biogenesis protein CcdA [Aliivibrio sp. 1S165]OCH23772.1 cytochrome C biogenesis protein CcdA [Aliivibrio sp. 1S128]OCH31633.1 cytochrome C biogenesis protein CcdA [Aliivibrio sp. 1S175]